MGTQLKLPAVAEGCGVGVADGRGVGVGELGAGAGVADGCGVGVGVEGGCGAGAGVGPDPAVISAGCTSDMGNPVDVALLLGITSFGVSTALGLQTWTWGGIEGLPRFAAYKGARGVGTTASSWRSCGTAVGAGSAGVRLD